MMGIADDEYSDLIRHLSPLIRKMDKITSLILSIHLNCFLDPLNPAGKRRQFIARRPASAGGE